MRIDKVDNIPTVFITGDSTVTDQPREPTASWGQMLTRFFKPGVAVANHAESGETLKSFITGLRLDKILSQMKKGDYLFMQFGHNDQKANWPQTYVEPFTTHKQYLKVFIAEARRRGAIPVLVTPMQRRNFDDQGKIRNTLGDFPESVRQTAKEENVALIDLTAMSIKFYEALGPAKAPLAFSGGRDATHHSDYGAYELAKCIVEGIKDNRLDLAKYIRTTTRHSTRRTRTRRKRSSSRSAREDRMCRRGATPAWRPQSEISLQRCGRRAGTLVTSGWRV